MLPVDRSALDELERTLHTEIPLTRAMGVRVAQCDGQRLTLSAPIVPNLNHKKTAFGGSLATLATLACWGSLQLLLNRPQRPVTVVIQENSVRYLRAVEQDFAAVCELPEHAVLEKFMQTLDRHGRARLELESRILTGDSIAVEFTGRFVAWDRTRFKNIEPV